MTFSLRQKKRAEDVNFQKEIKNLKKITEEITQCFEKGNYERCIELSLILLEKESVKQTLHFLAVTKKNLASSYFKIQDFNTALVYYNEALEIIEKNPEIEVPKKEQIEKEINITKILKLAIDGYSEKAIVECDLLIENNPEDIAIYELKGNVLHTLKKYEEAIAYYDFLCNEENISLKKGLKLENLFHKIGICYFNLNNLEKANEYFKKALNINPSEGKIYLALGETEFKQGFFEKAVINLEKGEKFFPKETSFLIFLIECYRQLEQNKKIIIKSEKIIKSDDQQTFIFLIEWIKKIENKILKKQIFLKFLPSIFKKQMFLNILEETLIYNGNELIESIQEFKKEKELNPKKNNAVIKSIETLIIRLENGFEAKKEQVKEISSRFTPFFEEKEIEETLNEWKNLVNDALEYKVLEKIIKDHGLPQEWTNFAELIKKEQENLLEPLKAINYFLIAIENIKDFNEKVIISFEDKEHNGIKIEETMINVKFIIFTDFPYGIKNETLKNIAIFYKKRMDLWEELPELISRKKFSPPLLPSIKSWAEKIKQELPNDPLFLEELNREGNNLKLDLLMETRNKNHKKETKWLAALSEKSDSIPFKSRFEIREITAKDGELKLLAYKYFFYIRKNTITVKTKK